MRDPAGARALTLRVAALERRRHSLRAAAESGAEHVSVYDLQVEDGTAFGRWYAAGATPLPEEEVAAQMFREASRPRRVQ